MNSKNLVTTFENARQYFPALSDDVDQNKLSYFDNSAGTQVSNYVIDNITNFLINHNAQKGTIFKREEWMSQKIVEARQLAADFIGAKDHTEIAIGLNASTFFQMLGYELGQDLDAGDHVIVTDTGHWSNIDPWQALTDKGVHVHVWQPDSHGNLDYEQFGELLTLAPKIVAAGWVSNATGTIFDMKKITKMAHEAGALVIADAVQQVPHLPTAIKDADVDFAAFSSYKIFGPHLGFCYFNRDHLDRLDGYRMRDSLTHDATAFEIGTQNHEGILGFKGAMDYLSQLYNDALRNGLSEQEIPLSPDVSPKRQALYSAMYWVKEYEQMLSDYFLEQLEKLPHVELYGEWSRDKLASRVPVFSFNLEGWRPEEIGEKLDGFGIEARTGNFHNAVVKHLAKRFNGSAVRISMIHYNSFAEIDYLFQCLEQMVTDHVESGS
ncbi:cysteine desulfurase-like protein [Barrientosiimonas marina]|uniref:Aminotransferase class V-fold PLP-dependent enzyme n=1 Tax=Lentibacillus kimchii TaxID=1542911 RepID=A0ABW2UU25_9BACI